MKLVDQYRQIREKFNGRSLKKHVATIGKLIKETNSETLLDYGCGGAVCYKERTKDWNVKVTLYDPAFPGIDVLPEGRFDAVICTDVLEHIPEDELDETLANIFSRASKFVFLSISTKLAHKTLPNGLNAHVTVKPQAWWLEKIEPHKTCSTHIHFD